MTSTLERITGALRNTGAVGDKIAIRGAYEPAAAVAGQMSRLGDDCAVIPEADGGYLLLAAEGLLPQFVADDPWFAGYCAVMVNVSDVCAMGGRPLAIVDVLWTPDHPQAQPVWDGMRAAARAYGVPIVGGHTTLGHQPGPVYLAAAILGRARSLLTSFDARPGDSLVVAIDTGGAWRGDKPFWNASVGSTSARLRDLAGLLPRIAENGWCRAAKDISNGGIVGTVSMLLECSRVGARVQLAAVPRPAGEDLSRWLVSFPSFGFILSVPPSCCRQVGELFAEAGVCCRVAGGIDDSAELTLELDGESEVFWRLPAEDCSMPEVVFQIEWPDGTVTRSYSPSTVVAHYFHEGMTMMVSELVAMSSEALERARDRVERRFGFRCSSAAAELELIRSRAAGFRGDELVRIQSVARLDAPGAEGHSR